MSGDEGEERSDTSAGRADVIDPRHEHSKVGGRLVLSSCSKGTTHWLAVLSGGWKATKYADTTLFFENNIGI